MKHSGIIITRGGKKVWSCGRENCDECGRMAAVRYQLQQARAKGEASRGRGA